MEIPAWLYFSVWAIIGVTFLLLGFDALDKTDLSNTISPVVMSIFMHSLAISTCHSSSYALLFLPQLKIPPDTYYMWMAFAVFPLVFNGISGGVFEWYYPIYSFINISALLFYFLPRLKQFSDQFYILVIFAFFPLLYYTGVGGIVLWYCLMYMCNFGIIVMEPRLTNLSEEKLGLVVHFAVESSIFYVNGKAKFFPILVLFIAFPTSVYWTAISGDERFERWLPYSIRENLLFWILKRIIETKGKVIEFAVGMFGTILFQNYFRLTTFDHIMAFLYLAVAWLANLALLMSFQDLGIFNFLLTNVIVGCTVSQFGLRGTTWLAYGASIFLYTLRLKLETLFLVKRGKEDVRYCITW